MDLYVRSEHPSFKAPKAIDRIRGFAPEIDSRLKQSYPNEFAKRIKVKRNKTFVVDPVTVLVTVVIYVGLKVADKVIEKMTEDVYDEVKGKLTEADVSKSGKHRTVKGKRR